MFEGVGWVRKVANRGSEVIDATPGAVNEETVAVLLVRQIRGSHLVTIMIRQTPTDRKYGF